jgi:DNA end-binding protein Ku
VPDTGAGKAYHLLLDAMESSGKVAVARVVLRSKEHLVAIRPRGGVLAMETMLFEDEVISPDTLEELPADGDVKTSKRELDMAKQLIDSLSSDFEPGKYRDEYRERVLELIERKAQGEEIVIEAPAEQPQKVPDLMSALEASIAAAKGPAGAGRRRVGGEEDGKKPPARARRKPAKKS